MACICNVVVLLETCNGKKNLSNSKKPKRLTERKLSAKVLKSFKKSMVLNMQSAAERLGHICPGRHASNIYNPVPHSRHLPDGEKFSDVFG